MSRLSDVLYTKAYVLAHAECHVVHLVESRERVVVRLHLVASYVLETGHGSNHGGFLPRFKVGGRIDVVGRVVVGVRGTFWNFPA